jgi:hypothetical protein
MGYPKIVTSPHYHLWTDALHARTLARQAQNKWDRGTYVRWTVTTSWTVLEIACQDALNEPKISFSFRKYLDAAIKTQGFSSINWGSGIWQQVTKLQKKRKGYTHRFLSESDLFPQATLADEAIETVRNVVVAIYQHVGRPAPIWIQDNDDRGWDIGVRASANATLIHAGASEEDPNAIQIYYVRSGEENLTEVLPAGTDYLPYVYDLIKRIQVPITSVRVYKGTVLVHETETQMRGA